MHTDNSPEQAVSQTAKIAPEAVTLRAQPRPVTRLNRRTLAALVGGVSVAVLGATIWSLQPQRRGNHEQTELYNVDRVAKSEGLDALPTDYSKLPPDVPELGPPLPGDLGPAIVNSQQPVIAAYTTPAYDLDDVLRKEAEAAAASSVFFRTNNQGQAAQTAHGAISMNAINTLAAFDPMAAGPASTAVQPAAPTTTQNRQDQKEAFLPGDIIAAVTEPVYDTATGQFLLIPQGSRILGRYNSQVSYGQSRVQVVWQPESQPRPLRHALRANLRRNRRCRDTHSLHARCLHGRGQGIQKGRSGTEHDIQTGMMCPSIMPHSKTRSSRLHVLRSGYREAYQAMIAALAGQQPRQSSLPQRDTAFSPDALMWPPAYEAAALRRSLNGS